MLNNFIDRIKLSFRKDKELYFSLYQILGFYPHEISYYKMALMHKSIMHRNAKGKPMNNERLEFLGDAVLDAVVGDIVYKHFPGKREGFLTNTRSKLVQRDTLNKLAQEMASISSFCRVATAIRTIAIWEETPLRLLWELSIWTEVTMSAWSLCRSVFSHR